jgi:folate-binding protein YgfZ
MVSPSVELLGHGQSDFPNMLRFDMDSSKVSSGYQALRERAAWRDLSARGRIRATGDDRARLLHAMTTNQVQKLQPGQGCYVFFLNAQGRILADANLFCLADSILLDTEPETRLKLFEHLDRYIIADDVTLHDETEATAAIGIEGPEAAAVLEGLGAPEPSVPWSTMAWREGLVARVDTTGAGGFSIILPAATKPELVSQLDSLGIPQATPDDACIVRLENGRPRYGEEITERYLVQETGQLQAVSFNKGCYLGQEIVERVRSRAQIHRVLRKIEIESSSPPAPGVKLKSGDADAAEIASAVYSPALGRTVAMAYVRVQFAEPGTELNLDRMKAWVR